MPWNDDTWPSVEEVLDAHREDDEGYCANWDCIAHGEADYPEGWTHTKQIADVIRWLLRPRPAILMVALFTANDDGSTTQNLPVNRYQRTNWTGPRRV